MTVGGNLAVTGTITGDVAAASVTGLNDVITPLIGTVIGNDAAVVTDAITGAAITPASVETTGDVTVAGNLDVTGTITGIPEATITTAINGAAITPLSVESTGEIKAGTLDVGTANFAVDGTGAITGASLATTGDVTVAGNLDVTGTILSLIHI